MNVDKWCNCSLKKEVWLVDLIILYNIFVKIENQNALGTGNKSLLSHQPASVIFLSCTVFKGLLKTPKHDTKKDKLVSIYESLTAVLY